MLSLAPPYRQYGTMVIYADSADPTQFYYLPNAPHLSVSEEGRAAIQLLVYKQNLDDVPAGGEEAVAFLSLDVDLSFSEEALKQATSRLTTELGLATPAKLSPVTFRRGTARFLLLDQSTPAPGKEGEPPAASEWVTRMYGAASPSLFGENRAIFQAMLPKKGAAAISGALDGFTPIGVVYELVFAGLQPAYRIKVHADWHKVYTHFSELKKTSSIFYESRALEAIDKLVEQKVIEVQDSILGVDEEGMKADHDAVMADLRKYVLDTFFQATLTPEKPVGEDIGSQAVDVLTGIAAAPFSMWGKVSHELKEVSNDQLRTLDVDWSTSRAAERTVYPQAHLSTVLQGARISRDEMIKVVSGEDEMWRTIGVDVTALAAWDDDGIEAITVDIEYPRASGGPRTWSVSLTKEKARESRRAWLDASGGRRLRYRYTVVFSANVPGPTRRAQSPWIEQEGTVIAVDPRDLFSACALDISLAPAFDRTRYPAVEVMVRHQDDKNDFRFEADGVLDDKAPAFKPRFRRADATVPVEIRLRHHAAAGAPHDTGWMPMDGTTHVVTDPFPSTLSVQAVPVGDRANIAVLLVDLEYVDEKGGIRESKSLTFEGDKATPQVWSIHVADPTRRRYRYRVTLSGKDGSFLTTDWMESEAPSLPVGETYLRLLDIDVSLQGKRPPDVEKVVVQLSYDDAEGNIHESKPIELVEPGSRGTWQVKIKDPGRRQYTYAVTWKRSDGFDRKTGPTTSNERYLVVSATPPAA